MCLFHEVYFPNKIIDKGFIDNYKYVICKNNYGFLCGYIRVDITCKYFGEIHYNIDYDCHGGITFSRVDEKFPHKWWLGFDCGHWNDLPNLDLIEQDYIKDMQSLMLREEYSGDLNISYKDEDYVLEQLILIVNQLNEEHSWLIKNINKLVRRTEVNFTKLKNNIWNLISSKLLSKSSI